jgi:hypothetical protein
MFIDRPRLRVALYAGLEAFSDVEMCSFYEAGLADDEDEAAWACSVIAEPNDTREPPDGSCEMTSPFGFPSIPWTVRPAPWRVTVAAGTA